VRSMPYSSAKYRWTLVYIAAVVTVLFIMALVGAL
jgi:hypothetical protein